MLFNSLTAVSLQLPTGVGTKNCIPSFCSEAMTTLLTNKGYLALVTETITAQTPSRAACANLACLELVGVFYKDKMVPFTAIQP